MISGKRFCNDDTLTQSAMATACRAQGLIAGPGIADAELEIRFHKGAPSPLGLVVHQWLPADDRQTARARRDRQEEAMCRFWPPAGGHILSAAELREELAVGMSELIRFCRFSLGNYQFGFDFGTSQITARKGLIRDFVFGRRFFLQEIPGLHALAAAFGSAGEVLGRKR